MTDLEWLLTTVYPHQREVFVLDNASVHHSTAVQAALTCFEQRVLGCGCRLTPLISIRLSASGNTSRRRHVPITYIRFLKIFRTLHYVLLGSKLLTKATSRPIPVCIELGHALQSARFGYLPEKPLWKPHS